MTRWSRSDAVDLEANGRMAEALAPAVEDAPAAKIVAAPAVKARFRLGAFETTCHRCGGSCWSIITKTHRFGKRMTAVRELVSDDATPHTCKEAP